jgi:hypothetical protein
MTVPKSGLKKFVSTLSETKMGEIRSAMLFALGYDG